MEFWVVTRERGSQEDAREIEDKKRSLEKAWLFFFKIHQEILSVHSTWYAKKNNTKLNN